MTSANHFIVKVLQTISAFFLLMNFLQFRNRKPRVVASIYAPCAKIVQYVNLHNYLNHHVENPDCWTPQFGSCAQLFSFMINKNVDQAYWPGISHLILTNVILILSFINFRLNKCSGHQTNDDCHPKHKMINKTTYHCQIRHCDYYIHLILFLLRILVNWLIKIIEWKNILRFSNISKNCITTST